MSKKEFDEEKGWAPYKPDKCSKCRTLMVFDESESGGDIDIVRGSLQNI
jgi:hypothetical protein